MYLSSIQTYMFSSYDSLFTILQWNMVILLPYIYIREEPVSAYTMKMHFNKLHYNKGAQYETDQSINKYEIVTTCLTGM